MEYGHIVCDVLQKYGIIPIAKHIPGHGRATVDSHLDLPEVNASKQALLGSDFMPFSRVGNYHWAMVAHILYSDIDSQLPSSLSKRNIQVIRRDIGFDGILITDDLSMKALKFPLVDITKMSIDAGCDIMLHCNGDIKEMAEISDNLDFMNAELVSRINSTVPKCLSGCFSSIDIRQIESELGQLVGTQCFV